MNNPYLAAFTAARDAGQLTPLLDADDAERRSIETIEQGLTRLDPSDLAAAARDFTEVQYASIGIGRHPSSLDDEVRVRSLLAVGDVLLAALPRELARLTAVPDPAPGDAYPALEKAITYLATVGRLEKRVGEARHSRFIFAARNVSMRADLSAQYEREHAAQLAAYEQHVRSGGPVELP